MLGTGIAIGSRIFGAAISAEGNHAQRIPEEFLLVEKALHDMSALMSLPTTASPTAIYNAYGKDFDLLGHTEKELTDFMSTAIRCAISINKRSFIDLTWETVRQSIPPKLCKIENLSLTAELAGLPSNELLADLQNQFTRAAKDCIANFVLWLHTVAENELLGLVEWTSLDACKLHSFRHRAAVDTSSILSEREIIISDEQKKIEITHLKEVAIDIFRHRDTHHVVGARNIPIGKYPMRKLPRSVRQMVRAMPAILRPQAGIIEGNLTMKEEMEVRRDWAGQSHTETAEVLIETRPAPTWEPAEVLIETRPAPTWEFDPGIVIGPFCFGTWVPQSMSQRFAAARERIKKAWLPCSIWLRRIRGTAKVRTRAALVKHGRGAAIGLTVLAVLAGIVFGIARGSMPAFKRTPLTLVTTESGSVERIGRINDNNLGSSAPFEGKDPTGTVISMNLGRLDYVDKIRIVQDPSRDAVGLHTVTIEAGGEPQVLTFKEGQRYIDCDVRTDRLIDTVKITINNVFGEGKRNHLRIAEIIPQTQCNLFIDRT